MLARVRGCAMLGVEGTLIEVEVNVFDGPEAFTIAGLPAGEVYAAQERVRAALTNGGYLFPHEQVRVKLVPAVLFTEGSFPCDLAIAVGILLASGQIHSGERLDDAIFLGTLSADGSVLHTNGVLPMVELAREKRLSSAFVPGASAVEATLVEGVTVYPVARLEQLVAHLNGERYIKASRRDPHLLADSNAEVYAHDMAAVRGQESVKRALEIAASGGHHMLLSGAPGSGKTLLARTLPTILPPMTREDILASSKIYSASGMLSRNLPLILQRPFRAPPSSISDAALLGGGSPPFIGEVSLAHGGVLFLDELSSFDGNVLKALPQVLAEKRVKRASAGEMRSYPAHVLLISAMRPCPCGFLNDPVQECVCSATAVTLYQDRLSGSLPDCFDMCIEVPRIAYERLADKRAVETSAIVRARVQAARARQQRRFAGTKLTCNAEIGCNEGENFCQVDAFGEKLLEAATQQLHLSAQTSHRVLRLARTIADLAGSESILAPHIAEAMHYRPRITGSMAREEKRKKCGRKRREG